VEHQVTLLGGPQPVLFIGRKRGGGMIATLPWPALLEISELVEQRQNVHSMRALRAALRRTFQAQEDAGELRRPLAARRGRR
jgi:hypothetical protein